MRRLVAILAALVLSLSLSVPIVAAQEGQYVTGITVTSATVNKMGEVHISGYLYCQGFQEWDDRNVEVQGQLIQAFGRKTTVRGGMGGGAWCELNGPTNFDAWAWADWGKFGPGWSTLQIGFGRTQCDEFNCWWNDMGGNNFYIKVVK
jgi:hypothetical protein